MRAKPQFRQHFILTLLDIRAHVSARSVSDILLFFFVLSFFPAGFCGFWIFGACMRAKLSFGNILSSRFSHSCPRFCEKRLGQFFLLFCFSLCLSCHFVAAASCGFWIFVACMRPKPQLWHQLLPNLISLRVPRAYAHQRIHAQSIIPFVFQEQSITRESMPKA